MKFCAVCYCKFTSLRRKAQNFQSEKRSVFLTFSLQANTLKMHLPTFSADDLTMHFERTAQPPGGGIISIVIIPKFQKKSTLDLKFVFAAGAACDIGALALRQTKNRTAFGASFINVSFSVSETHFLQLEPTLYPSKESHHCIILAFSCNNIMRKNAKHHISDDQSFNQKYSPKSHKEIENHKKYPCSEKHKIQLIKSVNSIQNSSEPLLEFVHHKLHSATKSGGTKSHYEDYNTKSSVLQYLCKLIYKQYEKILYKRTPPFWGRR